MKKLLIIQLDQFGFLTDTLKWCEILSKEYQIDIVCYDSNRPKVSMSNVQVHYVALSKNRILHAIRYILFALMHMLFFQGKIIVIAFPNCNIFKRILPWKKMHLDIRTVSVARDDEQRVLFDSQLYNYSRQYDSVSIISNAAAQRLKLESPLILPLGADVISNTSKCYSDIKLLYVGTLKGRDMHKTIEGAAIFHQKHPDVQFCYDIIGDGPGLEKEKMSDEYRDTIKKMNLENYVHIHGSKPYSELADFFDKSNYGVSFVPLTSWYDVQPPTKTYEYAMSGLYVIGTRTTCNREIITHDNGILIEDSAESFASALECILFFNSSLSEAKIRSSLADYQWGCIVESYLKPILER